MKKALIAIVLVVMAPFLLLVPVIGAASSVDGFFDPDSGEDFDVENYKTSDTVLKITSWYEEYISEYEKQLNDRKKEVEKEHTTTETVPKEKPQNPSEEKEIKTESRKVTKKPQLIVGNKDRDQKSDEMTLYDPAVHQQNPAVHQVIKGMLKKVMTAQREKTVSRKRRLRRQSRGRYAMSMSSLKWMNFR